MKIIFEFLGGPMDGKTVFSNTDDASSSYGSYSQASAAAYYTLTDKGTIGARFWTASEYALDLLRGHPPETAPPFQPHKYEVTDKLEVENEVLVRCQYINDQQTADEENK